MKLVIDIPEDMYNDANILIVKDLPELKKIIANGTPLPKGHGRLIDASMLRSMYAINRATIHTVVDLRKWVDGVPTIIEADTEAENEDSN